MQSMFSCKQYLHLGKNLARECFVLASFNDTSCWSTLYWSYESSIRAELTTTEHLTKIYVWKNSRSWCLVETKSLFWHILGSHICKVCEEIATMSCYSGLSFFRRCDERFCQWSKRNVLFDPSLVSIWLPHFRVLNFFHF